jgi:SAM-dependent methyltransferase
VTRRRALLALLAAALAAIVAAVARHLGAARARPAPGGILIADPAAYDALSRLLLGSLFGPIAADVAASAGPGARVLEVGCGPGRLAIRLAREHGLDVTGVDLDPGMIERALANVAALPNGRGPGPSFAVGDAASLPFADRSFDLVVSTLSLHHWADPAAGLAEIGRVLRPGGRALVWDLRRGLLWFHARVPDPVSAVHGTPLRVASVRPWRWPWRLPLMERLELVREGA